MLEDKTLVTVLNRNNGNTSYSIDEMNGLRRVYAAGESKKVTFEELRKLSYQPGGMYLLKNYLVIFNEEAVKELIGDVEPEYYYSEKDITDLLAQGSIDALYDCLNFAPVGVIELVKNIAVSIKLNDVQKRELIFKQTGFNVDNAIRNNAYSEEEEKKEAPKRRVGAADNAPTEAEPKKAGAIRIAATPAVKKEAEPTDEQ